ncbi:hypothetical protein [Streptomyces sp. NPDC057428]|uniref:hypothetical protein n=1 Tax=Streptomyces sp. NPDC057428 TaxID=3346129 RepID=UPI00369F9EF3
MDAEGHVMADEQHEWLDSDAAEKLLRGASVESVDDHTTTGLAQLEAALRAVRTPAPARGELPGEAVATAAFREASGSWKRAGTAHSAPIAGNRGALPAVRIRAESTAPRRPRWGRTVRFGLAVSLVGCALGGVAVAGGAGMFPTPFGSHGSPVPAASVSGAASPEEMGGEAPEPERSVAPPSGTPKAPSPPPRPKETGGAEEEPADGEPPSATGGDGSPAPEGGTRDRGTGDHGARDGTDGRDVPGGSAGGVFAKSVRACREYRADALSEEQERRLVALADGEENLDRFCDRVLAADGRNGGNADEGRGDGKDHGKDDGGNSGGGSLPPVTFHTWGTPGGWARPTTFPSSPSTLSVRR